MIVPQYWAEAKLKTEVDGKPITVKRFGWSDVSEAEAQANAQKRAEEAIAQAESGEKVRLIDHKVPYNGAEGLPIREEVISRHHDTIITRNSYGALCLNTPNALFADIDFQQEPSFRLGFICFLILLGIGIVGAVYYASWGSLLLFAFLALVLSSPLASILFKIQTQLKGGMDKIALGPVYEFSEENPSWNLRVYKTPNGYRILVMHKTFDPRSDEAIQFLKAINSDPQYVAMCKNQNCFRARITPKPWRIGKGHIRHRHAVWPISPEKIAARQEWINDYEKQALEYASCRFIEQLGNKITDATVEQVRQLHDEYCRADTNLKLA